MCALSFPSWFLLSMFPFSLHSYLYSSLLPFLVTIILSFHLSSPLSHLSFFFPKSTPFTFFLLPSLQILSFFQCTFLFAFSAFTLSLHSFLLKFFLLPPFLSSPYPVVPPSSPPPPYCSLPGPGGGWGCEVSCGGQLWMEQCLTSLKYWHI